MTILEKIDKLRRARGWSINNLAMEAMLTQSTLNNLYTRKTDPKIHTLQAICNAFGITMSDFFKENSELNQDDEFVTLYNALDADLKKSILTIMRRLKND